MLACHNTKQGPSQNGLRNYPTNPRKGTHTHNGSINVKRPSQRLPKQWVHVEQTQVPPLPPNNDEIVNFCISKAICQAASV